MVFCTDVDLLHWEPNLFADAGLASQTLISGTGDLAGTAFTMTSSGSFTDAHVEPDHVISLTGGTSGCYPVVSVDGATQLTLSVLYDGLFPLSDGGSPEPSPVGTAAGLSFAIRTFWPQRRVVSELLLRCGGIEIAEVDTNPGMIVSPQSLRRACVLGALNMIYSALAATGADASQHAMRAELYERLYRRALRNVKLDLDLDGDGRADTRRAFRLLPFVRE